VVTRDNSVSGHHSLRPPLLENYNSGITNRNSISMN